MAESKFSDLSLNFTPHPVRKDVIKLLDDDAIKRSVRNLVLTNHYERPFHPEIGSNVRKLLFDNITSVTSFQIQREIIDVIQNFEPRVKLKAVTVVVDPDNNGYSATIEFYILNSGRLVTVDSFLERLR